VGLVATIVGSVAAVAAVAIGAWQTRIAIVDYRRRHPQHGDRRALHHPADTGATSLDLNGQWWAAWQTFNKRTEIIATQPVEIDQEGRTVQIRALERSEENVRGGYVWSGELRIWDNHVLMGWYMAEDPNVRSKGTFFFVLHAHGNLLEGRWTGTSYDGPIVSGWAGIARTREEAAEAIEHLKRTAAAGSV
jgi:hypothetical protein